MRDLLSRNTRERLELRESPERGVHVRGLKEFAVKSAQELRAVLEVSAGGGCWATLCALQDCKHCRAGDRSEAEASECGKQTSSLASPLLPSTCSSYYAARACALQPSQLT